MCANKKETQNLRVTGPMCEESTVQWFGKRFYDIALCWRTYLHNQFCEYPKRRTNSALGSDSAAVFIPAIFRISHRRQGIGTRNNQPVDGP